ncbi:multidrug resistance protein, putative [Talaromyces stipitatus ATCC 10500]|uniref:Multidrug resistance protein, putative n=1 Tax=Talaromyces stipitatus (strain ATCC 10500 / CBS 375.48 / QM 6759 / NRRL 1006) TaxID=441959 RepID=B8MB34_TALSN|nr:multidrug resistance protein, putative [Talaromyces stipitatus ATCC 10500]EED18735.1 multidrug resistance protein, putative [Talaromyces stipitatus ATCC 10500]
MSAHDCLTDASFGPAVQGCRGNFDFTLAFELYFFLIAPASIFILIAPTRIYLLFARDRCVNVPWLQHLKLINIIAYCSLQLTLIALWSVRPIPAAPAGIAASCLNTVVGLLLCLLSPLEHSRNLRTSSILNAYLLSVFLDAVVLRTLWLSSYDTDIRNAFTAAFTVKAVLLLLEAVEKQRYFISDKDRQLSPYAKSSIYNRAFFWWVNRLLALGYRRHLEAKDLDPLESAMAAEVLDRRFWVAWQKTSKDKRRLIYSLMTAMPWDLLSPMVPRLILIAFTIGQPLCLRRFLDYLQGDSDKINIGYGMIGAYFLIYFGIAISSGFYWSSWLRSLALMRSMLMTAIFEKTLQAKPDVANDKAALTLMSTDVDRIVNGLREVHELWANAIQIIIATYLLELELKYACAAPAVVAVGSFVSITYLSGYTKQFQKQWLAKLQVRIGEVSSMLDSIKGIKILGLTPRLHDIIAGLRQQEVNASKPFRLLGAGTSSIALLPQLISPVLAFAIYAAVTLRDGGILDVSRLFTSLSIISLLSQPLFTLFGSVVNSRAAIGCFERIEEYLSRESHVDYRQDRESDPESSSNAKSGKAVNVNDYEMEESIERDTKTRKSVSNVIFEFSNASFSWADTDKPTLRNISMTIERGTLNLIVGPSGVGKSALLKGLLGESSKLSGSVYSSATEIAWCDQTPWLINDTICQNILAGSSMDETLYSTIIHCCDLQTDLESLPAGDQTKVGSKGISLSGGQKKRIALARALYSRKDVMVLDEPFSGLDATTEKHIVQRCLGPNGLRHHWGTTVVLTTNSTRVLPLADQIVVVDKNGTISERGSYQSLVTAGGYIERVHSERLSQLLQQADQDENEINESVTSPRPKSSTQGNSTKPNGQSVQKPNASPATTAVSDSSIYRFYLEAIGIWPMAIFISLEAIWAFLCVFPVQWLKWWAEDNDKHPNKNLGLYLGVYATLQVTALGSSALVTWFAFSFIARKSGIQLHTVLLNATLSAPLSLFSKNDSGQILTRFSQDMQMVDMNLPLQLLTMAQNLFVCVAQAGLIGAAVGWVAVSYPALIAVLIAIQRFYLRTAKQMRLLDLAEKAPVYTQYLDALAGLLTIRAFKWQTRFRTTNYRLVDNSQKPWYLLLMVQRWLLLVLDLVTAALTVLIVGIAVKLRASIGTGGVAVALVQIITLSSYLNQLITTYTLLETTLGAIARIKKFHEDASILPGGTHNDKGEQPPPNWPAKGELILENAQASYGEDENGQLALDGISMKIRPGQKIGICGRTGSGKSSTVLALLRLLELNSGRILLDGLDLANLNQESVRSRLNGLHQESYFLTGSVRLNLDPYKTHESDGDEPLIKVLKTVQLWDVIEEKGGLDAELKKNSLSHGQQQLFCLARALLRPGKVVILDEITSSMDQVTDTVIQKTILSEFTDKTVLIIAHRLHTIMACDQVAVMDHGKCVEYDNPKTLLAKKESMFSELVRNYHDKDGS